MKGLVTMNTHVQYESPITSGKKFMAKVKLQGQGHEVKNYGTMLKVLSQGKHICNMKALSLLARSYGQGKNFCSSIQRRTRTQTRTVGLTLAPWTFVLARLKDKSCQKTTTIAGQQPSLNRNHGYWSFSKVGQTSRSWSCGPKLTVPCKRSCCQKEYTWNMKVLSLLVRTLWPRIKFFKSKSNLNFKVKVTR